MCLRKRHGKSWPRACQCRSKWRTASKYVNWWRKYRCLKSDCYWTLSPHRAPHSHREWLRSALPKITRRHGERLRPDGQAIPANEPRASIAACRFPDASHVYVTWTYFRSRRSPMPAAILANSVGILELTGRLFGVTLISTQLPNRKNLPQKRSGIRSGPALALTCPCFSAPL